MADVLYTNTDSIRAAIGVTNRELADPQIINMNVEDQLILLLDQVYPTHAALAARNAVGSAPPATPEEKAAWRALKLYCQYAAAVIVLTVGQNILVQSLTDGGVIMSRFSRNDIETTYARLIGMRDEFLSVLTGEDPVTSYLVNPITRSTPNYDPVTGC